ncbi:MAG: hypothetical protein ACYTEG_05525 [Planctomycetota bacterium]|jgi:hypothetical protein
MSWRKKVARREARDELEARNEAENPGVRAGRAGELVAMLAVCGFLIWRSGGEPSRAILIAVGKAGRSDD